MLVRAREAIRATATGQERLDRNAIALAQMPARRGVGTDRVDHADGLVPGDERVAQVDGAVEFAAVLLDIGAANAARFDPEQRIVTPDRRTRELRQLDG